MSSPEEAVEPAPDQPAPDQPSTEIVTGKRDRTKALTFKPAVTEKVEFKIVKGRGDKLGDIRNVKYKLSKLKPDDHTLIGLHHVVYKRPGKMTMRKRDLYEFSGLVYEDPKDKARAKERLSKLTLKVLNDLTSIMELPKAELKNKEDKVDRLLQFLEAPKRLGTKDSAAQLEAKKQKKSKAAAAKKTKTPVKAKGKKSPKAKTKTSPDDDHDQSEPSESEEASDQEEEAKPVRAPGKKRTAAKAPAAPKAKRAKKKAKRDESDEEESEESSDDEDDKLEDKELPASKVAEHRISAGTKSDKTTVKSQGEASGKEEAHHAKQPAAKKPTQESNKAAVETDRDAAQDDEDDDKPLSALIKPKLSEEQLWTMTMSELDKILAGADIESLTIRKIMTLLESAVKCDPEWLKSKKGALKEYMENKLRPVGQQGEVPGTTEGQQPTG